MGEDATFEYLYKFVSRDRVQPGGFAANRNLLDHGTLYVARFNPDGSGQWIELTAGRNGLTPERGFADQAEVLIKGRQASDLLGATKMDRPEWVAIDEANLDVQYIMGIAESVTTIYYYSNTSETFNSEPFSQTESTRGEIKSSQVSAPFWASKLIEATQEYVSPRPSIVKATVEEGFFITPARD
jgi:hypothetical protein